MTTVGAGMAEALSAVSALEGLLPAVDADVLFEMVLELEGLAALGTLELAQIGALVVTDHVTLKAVDVCERLVADLADLDVGGVEGEMFLQLRLEHETGVALRARVFVDLIPMLLPNVLA